MNTSTPAAIRQAQSPELFEQEEGDSSSAWTDTRAAARVGLLALGLGLGGFLVWAGLAPLDEGVPSPATVVVDTKRKAVQHLSGGIIKEVLVQEGQVVRSGDPLVRLEEAAVRANHEEVRQRYLNLRAMQARLVAEQSGATQLVLHPDLRSAASDPLIRQQLVTQAKLLSARRAALEADASAMEEAMEAQQATLRSSRGMLVTRRAQFDLLREELEQTRNLAAEGYAPRNRVLELERMVAETTTAMIDLTGSSQRAERSIAELRQKVVARREEYRKEVESQLAEVQREVLADAERLVAVRSDLERAEIRSPASGQVVGLSLQTVGGVLQPGQKIMDIVPAAAPLLLEVRVAPHLIDKVHAGLAADVRFSAFAHSPQLVVAGVVQSISADLLTDPDNPQNVFYLGRVAVTPEGLKTLGSRQLQPGMPAEVVIKTGERSLLTYLLHPLTKRLAASMKEE